MDTLGDLTCCLAMQALQLVDWLYWSSGELETAPFGVCCHFQPLDNMNGRCLQWAIVFDPREERAFVVLGGTTTAVDWLNNISILPVRRATDGSTVLFHAGFWNAVDNDSAELSEHIRSITRRVTSLVLCGHSKGGACAGVLAARLALPDLHLPSMAGGPPSTYTCTLITFGAPNFTAELAGNGDGLGGLEDALARLPNSVTWVHQEDPVPHVLSAAWRDVISKLRAPQPVGLMSSSSSSTSLPLYKGVLAMVRSGMFDGLFERYRSVFPNRVVIGQHSEHFDFDSHQFKTYGDCVERGFSRRLHDVCGFCPPLHGVYIWPTSTFMALGLTAKIPMLCWAWRTVHTCSARCAAVRIAKLSFYWTAVRARRGFEGLHAFVVIELVRSVAQDQGGCYLRADLLYGRGVEIQVARSEDLLISPLNFGDYTRLAFLSFILPLVGWVETAWMPIHSPGALLRLSSFIANCGDAYSIFVYNCRHFAREIFSELVQP